MYRKQRLTPKLRKKQKIVVSTPQNLWYDTGNNPAQKGKTADMEKVEISGAALAPLFRLSRDAVCGIAQGRIVFSNPAACRLFGADVTGESAAERFPDLEETGWGDSFAAVLTIGDTPRNITAVRSGEILILTIRTEEPETLPVPPTALRQMRSAAFNLRLSIEQLLKDEPETWDEEYDEERAKVSAVLYHSYYKLLHVTNQLADLNALAADDKLSWPKPLSFGDLIADLVDSAEIFLRRRNITFRFDPAGESLFVIGEQSKLEQLLLILIANCVRRTGDGGKIVFRLRPPLPAHRLRRRSGPDGGRACRGLRAAAGGYAHRRAGCGARSHDRAGARAAPRRRSCPPERRGRRNEYAPAAPADGQAAAARRPPDRRRSGADPDGAQRAAAVGDVSEKVQRLINNSLPPEERSSDGSFYASIPKRRQPFSCVMRVISSAETPLRAAIFSST